MLLDYQKQFIELARTHNALQFGDFTLKSGRQSPYFFNAGAFHSGEALAQLGDIFAATLVQAQANFDMLFGPAYKGIPLATTTAVALSRLGKDVSVCFDRKESKNHGEGGSLMGGALQGRVMIIDDVITAGTAKRQAIELIQSQGAQVAGILIALDRQERGTGSLSSVQELQAEYNLPVYSVLTVEMLIKYLDHQPQMHDTCDAVKMYQHAYGV